MEVSSVLSNSSKMAPIPMPEGDGALCLAYASGRPTVGAGLVVPTHGFAVRFADAPARNRNPQQSSRSPG